MKKQLSYSQRLVSQVHNSVSSPMSGVTTPYGMYAYVQCAAKCMNKKA